MGKELVKVLKEYYISSGLEEFELETLEDESVKGAQHAGLTHLCKKIEERNKGYLGTTTRCSKCGKHSAKYKSDEYRIIAVIFGELEILRARYVCSSCQHNFYPLDEELKLSAGKYQGRIKKRIEALGINIPYQQASRDLSEVFFEHSVSAPQIRVITNNCSNKFSVSKHRDKKLKVTPNDRVYLQIDGNMCPTRDVRKNKQDNGYREAKTAIAFTGSVELSKNRHEITDKVMISSICDVLAFKDKLDNFLENKLELSEKNQIVVIADGARWIWGLVEELIPEAICILDYTHAKQYLYKAAEVIFGAGNDFYHAWVKKQEELLFEDKVKSVIENISIHKDGDNLDSIINYLENHKSKMLYDSYRKQGYFIGSGTVESVAKSLTQSRLKSSGMRWNIEDANKLLTLRAGLMEGSLANYWKKLPIAA